MQQTAVSDLANEVAPWIEGMARVGYVAVGVVYAIVGVLAAIAGVRGSSAPDKNDAFAFILDKPFGKILLFIITAGLLGYALWRFIAGITDAERRGNKPKGLALRAGSIVRGIFYTGLAIEVGRFATRQSAGTSSDQSAKHWTARLMEQPFGRWLVIAAGLAIIGTGVYQLANAWRSKLSSQLRIGSMQPDTKRRIVAISRIGIAARGVVFTVVGISVLIAGIRHNAQKAQGSSGAMQMLAEPLGGALLVLIGVGLVAYGVYAFVNARYRRIATS